MFDWIQEFDTFLFDLDGLLVDSEPLHFAAFQALCKDRGYPVNWNFAEYCRIAHAGGYSLRDHMYKLYPEMPKKYATWLDFYQDKEEFFFSILDERGVNLLPGVAELLSELVDHKKKRVVVTHSKRVWTDIIRNKAPELNMIPNWVTREDYTEPKPSPQGFLLGIEKVGGQGTRIIGFEDAPRGIRALQHTPAKRVLVQREANFDEDFFQDQDFYFCDSLVNVGEALVSRSS
jgi:HAD superfamily hydrolase (TIGR01509 family)